MVDLSLCSECWCQAVIQASTAIERKAVQTQRTGRERETRLGLESGSEGGMLLCSVSWAKSVVSVVAARGAGVRLAGPADWS